MKKKAMVFLLVLILLVSVVFPAAAADAEAVFVRDTYGLLEYGEWAALEQRAEEISDQNDCGVYIITVDDYTWYGTGDVYDVTTQIYHDPENGFGMGEDRTGIILLLSMVDRDWAMFLYGGTASQAFPPYRQEELEGEFLDNFRSNDWYGGFSDYLEACSFYLELTAEGTASVYEGYEDEYDDSFGLYIPEIPVSQILIAIGAGVFIAALVCLILKAPMKSVRRKVEANAYTADGIRLTGSFDLYTHTTTTRRKIESSSGSSGGSRSHVGGGGTGRSGKF